jgi:hypothetical protein
VAREAEVALAPHLYLYCVQVIVGRKHPRGGDGPPLEGLCDRLLAFTVNSDLEVVH